MRQNKGVWVMKTTRYFLLFTCGLTWLHGCSQQRSQQFSHRNSDVIVGALKGPEAKCCYIFKLTGPQELCLPLQLQQTLGKLETTDVSIPAYQSFTDRKRKCTCRSGTYYLGGSTAHSHRSVRQARSRSFIDVTVTRHSISGQTS